MALEAAFHDLRIHLDRLREGLRGVHTTVTEDRPQHGDVVLVDVLDDALADVLGDLEEASAAAGEAFKAVESRADLERARRALATCQDRFNHLAYRYSADLVSYERIAALLRAGRERDREWRAWAVGVKQGLDQCRQPIYDASIALFRCWQEIAERVGMTAFSVQNTTIGQHVAVPQVEDLARIT